jgi:hypothetical protein
MMGRGTEVVVRRQGSMGRVVVTHMGTDKEEEVVLVVLVGMGRTINRRLGLMDNTELVHGAAASQLRPQNVSTR